MVEPEEVGVKQELTLQRHTTEPDNRDIGHYRVTFAEPVDDTDAKYRTVEPYSGGVDNMKKDNS